MIRILIPETVIFCKGEPKYIGYSNKVIKY